MLIKLFYNRFILAISLFFLVSSLFAIVYTHQLPSARTREKILFLYSVKGSFHYNVSLFENDLYEVNMIRDPDRLFLKLVDKVNVETTYSFNTEPPAQIIDNSLSVEIYISQPQVWSKKISSTLIQSKDETIEYNTTLDMPKLVSIAKNISQGLDLVGSRYTIFVNCTASTRFNDQGSTHRIVFPYSSQINIDLISKTVEFLRKDTYNNSTQKEFETQDVKIEIGSLELGVNTLRYVSVITFAISALPLLVYIGLNTYNSIKKTKKSIEHKIKKFRALIIDAEAIPEGSLGKIIKLERLEDLVKISQSIIKPIIHVSKENRHIFCLVDEDLVYMYEHEEQRENDHNLAHGDK